MAHVDGPFILRPGEGQAIDLGTFEMVVKTDGERTGGAYTLLEATEPPGFGPPLHIHRDAAEAFYVLEGEYRIFLPDGEHRCPAGSFIHIPAGIEHGFRVGDVPSRKLNLYSPGAMVGYFEELGRAMRSGDVDSQRLDEIALGYGMQVTGPVPDGYL